MWDDGPLAVGFFSTLEHRRTMEFRIVSVGVVATRDGRRCIEVDRRYCDALINVDKFSHIIVLWWISGRDNPDDRAVTTVYPHKKGGRIPELSGVFACRSPARPNPIGHSVVRVESVNLDECRVWIDEIDAFDGSPVIDIKPYLPSSDRVDHAVVAPWFRDLAPRYAD